jgi:uncharacterized protein YndB with AHSA1/START domain
MSERSIENATFVVERVYDASPDRTFAAWSDPQAKARWYSDPERNLELDFRVGGWERHGGTLPDGRAYAYQALFWDIVPGQRIVYTYEMLVDGIRISVSVATAEFKGEGGGTRLVFTEQGAFLDGHETPSRREQGMGTLLDLLGQWVESSRSDGD